MSYFDTNTPKCKHMVIWPQNGATEQPSRIANDRSLSNRRTFINFSSARESQMSGAAASKARRRGNDLLKMIELDVAHYELFDMPPVNEYELYMRSFGCSNTRQVSGVRGQASNIIIM